MNKLVLYGSAALVALLLTVGSFAFSIAPATVAYAQEATTTAGNTQTAPVTQQDDDNDVPWGLLGLLGLGGLAGLRRREEPTRVVDKTGNVKTYESK